MQYTTENLPPFLLPYHFIKETNNKQRIFQIVDMCSKCYTPDAADTFDEFIVLWNVTDNKHNYIKRPLTETLNFINANLLIQHQPKIS
jgi:hypothetical protein